MTQNDRHFLVTQRGVAGTQKKPMRRISAHT